MITARKGGYFGCYVHHQKDKNKCLNNRMVNRTKLERQVIQLLTKTLLDQSVLEPAAKMLNEKIKARLRVAPEELKSLERRQDSVSREVQNLLKFVVVHGDTSPTIKTSLDEKASELNTLKQQILALKTANVDKLLVTSFALREKFQRLTGYFETDPMLANAALRKLIPNGLMCRSVATTNKKNLNQNNSKWIVAGDLAIGGTSTLTSPSYVPVAIELGSRPNQSTMH